MLIHADTGARLQGPGEATLRSPPSTQEITDKLSGLFAGQRLLAVIQSVMPNGTYRALINQRSVTLALPFTAKTGDAIELEVTASAGKLTFAVRAPNLAQTAGVDPSSSTRLSRTGQLIQGLLGHSGDGKASAAALPLNGNRPISEQPPRSGQELSPLLQQAVRQSGMFYEAHQAAWVAGRLAQAELLQEPQARLTARQSSIVSHNASTAGVPAEMPSPDVQASASPQTQVATLATTPLDIPAGSPDGAQPAASPGAESDVGDERRAVPARGAADSLPERSSVSAVMPSAGNRLAAALATSASSADAGQPTEIAHPSTAVKEAAVGHDAGEAARVAPLNLSPNLSLALLAAMRQPATSSRMFQTVETVFTPDAGPQAGNEPASPEPFVPDSPAENSRQRIQPASPDWHPHARTALEQASHAGENDFSVQRGRGEDVSPLAYKGQDEHAMSQIVPQPLQSIVQQQLEAFATQHFSWQGQIWPGQQMHWEIDDQSQERNAEGKTGDGSEKWQTRLRLVLPKLGAVDARLQIHDRQMTLTLRADSAETRALLRSQGSELRQQLENAGLLLAALGVVQSPDGGQ